LARNSKMKSNLLTIIGIALIGSLICSMSSAQEPTDRSAPIDVEIVLEHRKDGKTGGAVTHPRNTKDLAASPLVNTLTGLDGRSSVVTISYVGYANFQVAENAKDEQLRPGHVFAIQVFSGKKGVTIKSAKENVTKLVIYRQSPQTLFENQDVSVTIRNKK
jgi:ABC-type antimicrobial peptide transport system permease subunit